MKGSRGNKGQMKKDTLNFSEESVKELESSLKELTDKMFKQGIPPKEAMGISNQVLEGIYAQAYRLYNTGKYTEAVHLFRLLLMLDPTEFKYMLGLAACFHMLKEYKNAIQAYTMCAILDPQSPIPHYHSADCFIQMKDFLSAMLCLELTLKRAAEKPEYAKIKERAQMSLESIKKQQQSAPSL